MAKRTKQRGRTVVELDPPVRLALETHCESSGRTITWVVNRAVQMFLAQPVENLIVLPKHGMVNQAVQIFLESQERPE